MQPGPAGWRRIIRAPFDATAVVSSVCFLLPTWGELMKKLMTLMMLLCLAAWPAAASAQHGWLDDPNYEDEPWVIGWETLTWQEKASHANDAIQSEILGWGLAVSFAEDDILQLDTDAERITQEKAGHHREADINAELDIIDAKIAEATTLILLKKSLNFNPGEQQASAADDDYQAGIAQPILNLRTPKFQECLQHCDNAWPHVDPLNESWPTIAAAVNAGNLARDRADQLLDEQPPGEDPGEDPGM